MAEKKARVVRGEHQGAFDPASVKVAPEGTVLFVSPGSERLMILLKDSKKTVVNGEVVTEPAVIVQFEHFHYLCRDKEIERMLRLTASFAGGSIRDANEVVKANRDRIVEDTVARLGDPEVAAAVMNRLKRAATLAPTVEAK